jgi:hypothetical protein
VADLGRKIPIWTLKFLRECIEDMTKDTMKFDCIIFIEGNRGEGKSTLAYQILKGLKVEIPFKPQRDILFSRQDTIKHLATKINGCIWSDELINVAYKRDFYVEDQKDLLKALDMYRDSRNVFVGCIPKFIDLDTKIQKLCKIRITVIRRGLVLIHLQKRTIFSNDPWDVKNNQKIENKWINRSNSNPKYGQLSTVRGLLQFGDLTPLQREEYEAIKKEKRSHIFGAFQDMTLINDPDKLFMTNMISKLKEGKLNPDTFELLCNVNNKKVDTIRININKMLKESGDAKTWRDYCISEKNKLRKDRLGFAIKDSEPLKPVGNQSPEEKSMIESMQPTANTLQPLGKPQNAPNEPLPTDEEDVFGFVQ